METFELIDKTIPQTKSRELVKRMIPVLVRWAQMGLGEMTYNEMIHILGYKHFSGIGYPLGKVKDVIDALSKMTGESIPSLNCLCSSSTTKLPSFGYSYVYPNYHTLNDDEKRTFVQGERFKAFRYEKWDWVLSALGLKPSPLYTAEELDKITRNHNFGSGGEAVEHKALKEFIATHPEIVGIKHVVKTEIEKILLSGDKLDVWFETDNGNQIAVEVKPSTSPDHDILRGIFQCVKYKAVMNAQRKLVCLNHDIDTLLVLACPMPDKLMEIAKEMEVPFVDGFKM